MDNPIIFIVNLALCRFLLGKRKYCLVGIYVFLAYFSFQCGHITLMKPVTEIQIKTQRKPITKLCSSLSIMDVDVRSTAKYSHLTVFGLFLYRVSCNVRSSNEVDEVRS